MQKGGWVYILTNKHHTVLYTGVTSNLPARINKHLTKYYPFSFTAKYNADKLVYYKLYDSIIEAITEEKRIKGGNRLAKIKLIEAMNLTWTDLWLEDVCKLVITFLTREIASCLPMTFFEEDDVHSLQWCLGLSNRSSPLL
ncbi:MAG: GIY-YIG nuclease family protein [Chitinophagaceae bacterium]